LRLDSAVDLNKEKAWTPAVPNPVGIGIGNRHLYLREAQETSTIQIVVYRSFVYIRV
jgi:hypothetical protein